MKVLTGSLVRGGQVWVAVVLIALCLNTGCAERQPPVDCVGLPAQDQAVQILAKQFITDGLKGYSQDDLSKLLSIEDLRTVEQDERHCRCKAKVSILFPADLGSKLGEAFLTLDGRRYLREKLETRFGMAKGPAMYQQVNRALSEGPYGVVPMLPTSEQLVAVEEVVRKNAVVIAGTSNKVLVTYEVAVEKNVGEEVTTSVKAYIDDVELFDLDRTLLSVSGLL